MPFSGDAPLAAAAPAEGDERQEVTWWFSWARADVAAAMVVVVEPEDVEAVMAADVGLLLPAVNWPNV